MLQYCPFLFFFAYLCLCSHFSSVEYGMICPWWLFLKDISFILQVEEMVLINPSVYAEGTGNLAKLPKLVAYAGVNI